MVSHKVQPKRMDPEKQQPKIPRNPWRVMHFFMRNLVRRNQRDADAPTIQQAMMGTKSKNA